MLDEDVAVANAGLLLVVVVADLVVVEAAVVISIVSPLEFAAGGVDGTFWLLLLLFLLLLPFDVAILEDVLGSTALLLLVTAADAGLAALAFFLFSRDELLSAVAAFSSWDLTSFNSSLISASMLGMLRFFTFLPFMKIVGVPLTPDT